MPTVEEQQRQQQEAYNYRIQEKLNRYIQNFPINIPFPAKVSSYSDDKPLRTNVDLVQHRLLEAGVLFSDLQQIEQITESLSGFVSNMNGTGCYDAVQVKLDNNDDNTNSEDDDDVPKKQQSLHVILNEKKWYKLYVGGGLKQDSINSQAADTLFPKVQFETSGSLLNLSGNFDKTSLSYTIDQSSAASILVSHDRPLFSIFPEGSLWSDSILSMENGSQYHMNFHAMLDSIDHEYTRSYKEFQRSVNMRFSNSNTMIPERSNKTYMGMNWSLLLRDIIPRRNIRLPYACDASPEVVMESGPTTKHSVTFEYRTNGEYTNDKYNPTTGIDYYTKVELATPPGDVGFCKGESGMALHMGDKSKEGVSFHIGANTGILHPLNFGGLCGPPTISDRFFVGGPMNLRGFLPTGIGPRAKTGGPSTPGGDALGGNFYYTATAAASVPFPPISFLKDSDLRLFGFCNAGTLTANKPTNPFTVLKSTRASIGGGICMSCDFGRFEATYAIPFRYGPRDARRAVQFGLGFNFG